MTKSRTEELSREIREFLGSAQSQYHERRRIEVDYLKNQASGWVAHAVSYGQMALRSALLLNGGGIIAVPAFAEMLGEGLWARGATWPHYAFACFVVGLVSALLATACAFFAMTSLERATWETINRIERVLRSDFTVSLGGKPTVDDSSRGTLTKDEKRYRTGSRIWQVVAIAFGVVAMAAFVVGAWIGGYIISGAPPAVGPSP